MKNLIIAVLALFLAGAIVAGFIFHGKYENTGEKLEAGNEKLSSLNDKIDQLTAENSKLSDQINKNVELDKKIDTLNKELETAVGRNTKLEDKLRLEKEMEASLKKEALSLKDMIPKLQGQLQGEKSLAESRIKELKSASNSLIAELEKQLENKEMTIKGFKKKLTITFVDRLLFDLGKASITTEGGSILGKVGNILKNVHGMQIWIVGHTDNVPIKKEYQYKFPSNWELSAARAAAVANYFQKSNSIDPETLTVIGRSFYEPVDTNNTKEGRARNRRVEVIIAPELKRK